MNTSDTPAKKRSPRHRHWARRTHRAVAIGAFSFLILIAATGLVLNHSDDLGLPQEYISATLAKSLYGIEVPPIDVAFEAGGMLFVTASNTLYANQFPLAEDAGDVRGAVVSNDIIVIVTDREILLATKEAALIERSAMDSSHVLSRIGLSESLVIIESGDANFAFDADQMRLAALETRNANVSWSVPTKLNEAQLRGVSDASIARVISWERILSDLHSGRILPRVGRYIFDLTALCLLYLCLSGVLLWFRRR